MKAQISVLTLVLILSITAVVTAHTAEDPYITDLIAGQTADVGDVLVWNDADKLYVQYKIPPDTTPLDYTDNWVIAKTHVHVAAAPDDIPQKNGNPIPGQFAYKNSYYYVDETPPLEIPLNGWVPGTELYIAAHADVEVVGGLDGLEMHLPDTVTIQVTFPYAGGYSYFPEVTISGGTFLDGVYSGWCVDTDHAISQNYPYTVKVYSSYGTIDGLVEYHENMDLVNWILNQHYVGQDVQTAFPGTPCTGIITYGDVQRAIWALIEDSQIITGLGPWSQCRVDEILAAANTYGEGYKPGCGDIVAIILAPIVSRQAIIIQTTIAELEIFCETVEETAWGKGLDFPGKNWAMYIPYTVQAEPEAEPIQ